LGISRNGFSSVERLATDGLCTLTEASLGRRFSADPAGAAQVIGGAVLIDCARVYYPTGLAQIKHGDL